jgi:hypothetical protein
MVFLESSSPVLSRPCGEFTVIFVFGVINIKQLRKIIKQDTSHITKLILLLLFTVFVVFPYKFTFVFQMF